MRVHGGVEFPFLAFRIPEVGVPEGPCGAEGETNGVLGRRARSPRPVHSRQVQAGLVAVVTDAGDLTGDICNVGARFYEHGTSVKEVVVLWVHILKICLPVVEADAVAVVNDHIGRGVHKLSVHTNEVD